MTLSDWKAMHELFTTPWKVGATVIISVEYLKVVPVFVIVLVTWCEKLWWCRRYLQSAASILHIWGQWGFSKPLWGAEVLCLLNLNFFYYGTVIKKKYKCHRLGIELLAQQVYWREMMKGKSKLSTINLPISPSWNWQHIILFDWNLWIYGSYNQCRLSQQN